MDRKRSKPEAPAYFWLYLICLYEDLDHMSKLDTKSKKCIFIGYNTGKYGYQFWDAEKPKDP